MNIVHERLSFVANKERKCWIRSERARARGRRSGIRSRNAVSLRESASERVRNMVANVREQESE